MNNRLTDYTAEVYVACMVLMFAIFGTAMMLVNCDENPHEYGSNGCEVGEKFPCGVWLRGLGHHCPPNHVLFADASMGGQRGQICVAYVDAIPDEAK